MTRYILVEVLFASAVTFVTYFFVWPTIRERWPSVAKISLGVIALAIFLFFQLFYFFTRSRLEDLVADVLGEATCALHRFAACPHASEQKTPPVVGVPPPTVTVTQPAATADRRPAPAALRRPSWERLGLGLGPLPDD
jgi:hypothetical protein